MRRPVAKDWEHLFILLIYNPPPVPCAPWLIKAPVTIGSVKEVGERWARRNLN